MWGSPTDDDAVASLIALAKDDWTDVGALVADVARRVDVAAPIEVFARSLGDFAGVLIDHDVVPGDLGADPDFRPWPGTKEERVARIVRETIELAEYPWPDDIAWLHYEP